MTKIDKPSLIAIVLISYIALGIGLYYGADYYIEKKDTRLRNEATEALDSFFKDKEYKYVDLHYNAYNIGYEQIPIPTIEKPSYLDILSKIDIEKKYSGKNINEQEAEKEILKNRAKLWDEKYGSYSKMYDLDVNPEAPAETQRGWALKIIERKSSLGTDGYCEYYLYPYRLAYKEVGPFLANSIPSITTAIQEALTFLTENDKSSIKEYFVKGSTKYLKTTMDTKIDNEYYHIIQDTERTMWWNQPGDAYGLDRSSSVEDGGMHNGYYEVLFKRTQPTTYSIKWVGKEVLEKDRNMIIVLGAILLTIIMLIVVIPLYKKIQKENKLSNETLYEKLLRLCSPANYMNPYNQEMVEKANKIYLQLKQISDNDIEKIKAIRQEAIETLGISFLDKEKIAELKDKCNPKNFMTPYQPEKLSIANDLYHRLSNGTINIDEVESIEQEIKKLET